MCPFSLSCTHCTMWLLDWDATQWIVQNYSHSTISRWEREPLMVEMTEQNAWQTPKPVDSLWGGKASVNSVILCLGLSCLKIRLKSLLWSSWLFLLPTDWERNFLPSHVYLMAVTEESWYLRVGTYSFDPSVNNKSKNVTFLVSSLILSVLSNPWSH